MAIFSNVEHLKMWVHKILPLVYDDSMSYYETLCKVVAKLNEVVTLSNEQTDYLNNWLTTTEESLERWKSDTETSLEEKINTDLGAAIDRLESEFADELLDAEGMIYGTQNDVPVEEGSEYYQNNAEYFRDESKNYANGGSEHPSPFMFNNAKYFRERSEAWANGEIYGEDVTSQDEAYENNGKYYMERSQAWANGKIYGQDVPSGDEAYENNAKYYAEQAREAALTFVPDPTLTEANRPAEAKATGDAIADLKSAINFNKTATPGYILTATNEGTGQTWSPVGTPTDAQTAAAVSDWLDDHPEATTTVLDGSISAQKLTTKLQGELKVLSEFNGNSDEDKLYDALITQHYKGTIIGGNITINNSIILPYAELREVRISNAVITLNDDLFATADSYRRIPSFINCTFIGNGHAIFKSGYVVCGSFVDCVFHNCSIINDETGTIQSAYLTNCEITNTSVPLIKVNALLDVHIIGALCEAQSATLIDTLGSTERAGGTRNLFISDSLFESFSQKVFKLSGGNIFINNSYFESNSDGCILIQKTSGLDPETYNYLHFQISNCRINSSVVAVEIDGYTAANTVVISVFGNNYYSANDSALISGLVGEDWYSVYGNSISKQTNIICSDALAIYEPSKIHNPTFPDSTKLIRNSGGWIQFGNLVFIDMTIIAKTTIAGTISTIITNLPPPSILSVNIELHSIAPSAGDNDKPNGKYLYITNAGVGSIYGGITTDERYRVLGYYFTNNKTVR